MRLLHVASAAGARKNLGWAVLRRPPILCRPPRSRCLHGCNGPMRNGGRRHQHQEESAGSRQAAEPKSLCVPHFLLASKNLSLCFGKEVRSTLREAANQLSNKLSHAQHLDEFIWTTKNWHGLHAASVCRPPHRCGRVADGTVSELACGESCIVHAWCRVH